MRNVALKMKNKELAACVIVWKASQQHKKAEHAARARAEAMCKRVGMRMLNRDLSDRVLIWSSSCRSDAAEKRGLGIMRRVTARLNMAEAVEAVANWRCAASNGILQMVSCIYTVLECADWIGAMSWLQWQQRMQKWEQKSNALELQLTMTAQVSVAC